jgi:hypothetical protein
MKRRSGGSRSIVGTITSKHGLAVIGVTVFAGLYTLGTIQSTSDTTSIWYKLGQWTGLKPKS